MEKEQEKPRYRVLPMHTRTFTQALDVAVTRCMVWREMETETPYSAMELLEFAQKVDQEHPLDGHKFYMVTTDGAIGISPGLEWLTTWMFVPMEDCQERDFILRKMQEDLQSATETREAPQPETQEAAEQAETVATESEKKEQSEKSEKTEQSEKSEKKEKSEKTEQAVPKRALNFCPYCGARVLPANKFCTQCGKSLIFS